MRRWWRGALIWLSGAETSLAIISLDDTTDLIPTIRRMRKSLRDIRDRAARLDARWAAVAMGGIVSDDQLMIIVRHAGIDRDTVWDVLERRWPTITISDLADAVAISTLTVQQTIRLAVARRGVEPIRVVIPAQHGADPGWDAMPVVV